MRVRSVPGTALARASGDVVYTPPEGESLLRKLLGNWEQFLHCETEIDPLIRMAVGHYQFEASHPFTDGNGRTGRLLNGLFLIHEGAVISRSMIITAAAAAKTTGSKHVASTARSQTSQRRSRRAGSGAGFWSCCRTVFFINSLVWARIWPHPLYLRLSRSKTKPRKHANQRTPHDPSCRPRARTTSQSAA